MLTTVPRSRRIIRGLILPAIAVLCATAALSHGQTVPLNLGGTTSYDGWDDLTFFRLFGYGGFPGNSAWPNPINSNKSGSGDAQLVRVSGGGGGGGPYPASESLYFGSFQQIANELGGTLRVEDATPVSGVRTIAFQIQIGEALGYDFHHPTGVPVLKINGQATAHASMTPVLLASFQNGTFLSPETGEEEPVYVNTWGFQWNATNLGTINSIQIEFSGVTHAQIYEMRLDQSTQTHNTSVFGGSSETRVIGLAGNLAFGNVTVGQNTTRVLTISNTGNSTLTVNSISYPNGFSGNWSSGTIAAGGSQNVTVTFAPNAAQSFSGNITVNSNATSGTNTIAVSGTGVAAQTRIIGLAGNLAFGNVTVGQTTTRTLTISNTGNSALTVNSISYPNGFSGNWNSGTIAAGGSQNVTVTFAPNAAQSFSGNITVNSNATSGTNTIAVSGTGVAAQTRIIGLSGNLAFGNVTVGQTTTRTLTISNTGNSALTINSISYPNGFSGNWNSGTIAAGGSQNVTVTFAPNTAQSFSGNITVNSNATAGTNSIALNGTGLSPAIRVVTPGLPQFNGSSTSTTTLLASTPNTTLTVEYAHDLNGAGSWTRHPTPINSGPTGQFQFTITEPGDQRSTQSRGFFRLVY